MTCPSVSPRRSLSKPGAGAGWCWWEGREGHSQPSPRPSIPGFQLWALNSHSLTLRPSLDARHSLGLTPSNFHSDSPRPQLPLHTLFPSLAPPPAPNILRPLTPSGTFASLSPILSSLWDIRPRSADPRFAPPRGGAGGGHPAGRALTVLRPPQVCAALSPLCASPAASPTTSASAAARPTCPEACTPCAPACASAITSRCARSPGPAGGEGWDWPPGSKAERLTFLPLSRALSGTTGRPSPSACPAPSVRWRGN